MPVKKLTNYEIYVGSKRGGTRVNKIVIDSGNLILHVGDEYDLTYKVYPSNAFYDEVEWISSNPKVVDIDEDGHIIAKKEGKVLITVKINGKTAMCTVNVKAVIHFEDPMVKKILVKNYDLDGDGEISYTEAKRVTSIPFPMFTAMPITTFDELKYFTNLKTIAQHAFDSCTYLTSIELPPSLEKINRNAFSYCDSLTSIMIPPHVQSIGTEAFSDCENFTTAYINSNIPPKNGKEIFKNCPSLDRIIVPAEFIDEYLNAINWGMLNEEEYLYYSYIIEECFDYTFDFFLS